MAIKFTKLNKAAVKKLEAGETIIEHGIKFERLPNGDGRYSVNIMVDGQRIHRVVGKESAGLTRTQAEDYIEQVNTDARADRLSLPKGRKKILGFSQAGKVISKNLKRKAEKIFLRKDKG